MAAVAVKSVGLCGTLSRHISSCLRTLPTGIKLCQRRSIVTKHGCKADFGFLFDIDGVIVRGKTILPHAREAFNMLVDRHGKFKVPVIFVTNAGNTLRQIKAKALSEWLGIEIAPDQVLMSHSPLKMFKHFQEKHILVIGQGPILEIAEGLGFSNTITMDTLRQCFPNLDMVDHTRRKPAPCAFEQYFPRVEGVVIFGEPVRWETNLQLIIDLLMSDGLPTRSMTDIPYPHLPVLACNMDLVWMAEAPMPRIANGCFLMCLETLYQKLSGRELKYTALVGKPSELTYHHADYLLDTQARELGMPGIKTIYCVGDNPESDIYGANLYDRYLQKRIVKRSVNVNYSQQRLQTQSVGSQIVNIDDSDDTDSDLDSESWAKNEEATEVFASSCVSILVSTGVYSSAKENVAYGRQRTSNHNHRDFVIDPLLTQPRYETHNVLEAVKLVFQEEEVDMAGVS